MEFKAIAYQREVLAKGGVKPLNLVHGEEEYLIRTLIDKIKETFGGVRVLWGDEVAPEEVIPTASEGDLFGAQRDRVVVIMNFEDLVKKFGRRKKALEEFTKTLRKLSSVRMFAVVPRKLSKEELGKEPYKTFSAHGDVISADRVPPKKIRDIVRRKFEREGGGIDEEALDLLIELCGGDLMVLKQEAEKILTYAGKERVTEETVRKVCTPWDTGSLFELMDHLIDRNTEGVIKTLKALERSGILPIQIQAALVGVTLRLYTLAVVRERGGDLDKVLDSIGVRHSFARTKMRSYLEKVTLKDLKTALEHLYRIDRLGKVFFMPQDKLLRDFLIQFSMR